MASALDALIFGIRDIFLGGVALPDKAALNFDPASFTVTSDDANGRLNIGAVPYTPSPHVSLAQKTTGTAYTIVPGTDYSITASGNTIAITLPLGPTKGDQYRVKSYGTGNTVAGNGKNIDGSASAFALVNLQSATFFYNGTQWEVH